MALPVVLFKSTTVCQSNGTFQGVEVHLYLFERIEGGVILILSLLLEIFVIVLHISPYLDDSFFDVSQAMVEKDCVGAIVCKLDMHKKMFRRGYIAMLAVDSKFRRKGIGKSCASMVALTSEWQQKGSFYRTRVCFSVSSWIHLVSLNALTCCYKSMVCLSVSKELDRSMCILHSILYYLPYSIGIYNTGNVL